MVGAVVQARLGSSRFPKKVLEKITEKELLWHVVERTLLSKSIDKIIIATTDNPHDDELVDFCEKHKWEVFRGSEENVLSRYFHCSKQYKLDVIVRVTADDPLKDSQLIDKCVHELLSGNFDYVSNNNPPSYPEGLDVEVFTFDALKRSYQLSVDPFEQEHVTQFILRNPSMFSMKNLANMEDLSSIRLTIDTADDFELISKIYSKLFNGNHDFGLEQVLQIISKEPEILNINTKVKRSYMYQKGQE